MDSVKSQAVCPLVITPTYNEAGNIERFVACVRDAASNTEILIIDDGSPDGTGQIVDALAKQDSRIHVIHRELKQGLGSAYVAGFKWALSHKYDVMIQMDADLSHDPKYLSQFMDTLNQGADVVLGSRNISGGGVVGWGLHRHILSKGGSLYSRVILGTKIRDMTGGYKAFRRHVLEQINIQSLASEGYAFQIETTYRALNKGFRIVEVPIVFQDRERGKSKMSLSIILEAIGMVWRLRLRQLSGRLGSS